MSSELQLRGWRRMLLPDAAQRDARSWTRPQLDPRMFYRRATQMRNLYSFGTLLRNSDAIRPARGGAVAGAAGQRLTRGASVARRAPPPRAPRAPRPASLYAEPYEPAPRRRRLLAALRRARAPRAPPALRRLSRAVYNRLSGAARDSLATVVYSDRWLLARRPLLARRRPPQHADLLGGPLLPAAPAQRRHHLALDPPPASPRAGLLALPPRPAPRPAPRARPRPPPPYILMMEEAWQWSGEGEAWAARPPPPRPLQYRQPRRPPPPPPLEALSSRAPPPPPPAPALSLPLPDFALSDDELLLREYERGGSAGSGAGSDAVDYSALLKPAARISAANLAASAPPRDKTREKKRLNTSVATLNNGSGRALLGGRRGRGGGGGRGGSARCGAARASCCCTAARCTCCRCSRSSS
ncbi:unnamed protein product [Plutella xylostella]|uniref:(diamondback moth) hypothetical protein n=1 Tax=Plutella xylostella TaxID=51655 RepID=A0A8S4FEU0_PLUXY|nr:unnamed protein product [Plutella xylostella]